MNKQKSYHHPPTNPNYFSHTNYFFPVQLGHPKLSGYGLLSTQGVQNRSQKYSSISQSGATALCRRDPDPPAVCRTKGVKLRVGLSCYILCVLMLFVITCVVAIYLCCILPTSFVGVWRLRFLD